MFTPSNKNKGLPIRANLSKNRGQKDSNLLKQAIGASPPIEFDLSFLAQDNKRADQYKPTPLISTSSTLASTNHLTKNHSYTYLRRDQARECLSASANHEEYVSIKRYQAVDRASPRVTATKTLQSICLRPENTEHQQKFNFQVSQPNYSIRNPQLQTKFKLPLNQRHEEEFHKLSHSKRSLIQIVQYPKAQALQTNLKPLKYSDCRLKLKDYLFMVNTSTAVAASKKRKLDNSVNYTTGRITQGYGKIGQNKAFNSKQSLNKQKYRISNEQINQVLRKQINTDINHLKSKLETIGSRLNESEDFDSQQLVQLYDLRRELQLCNQQIKYYCFKQASASCANLQDSIVNIIHQSDVEEQFIEV